MSNSSYSLNSNAYTWTNALLWGNCIEHFKKTTQGSLCDRTVHAGIALVECVPGLGQIVSIAEKVFTQPATNPPPGTPPRVNERTPLFPSGVPLKLSGDDDFKQHEDLMYIQTNPFAALRVVIASDQLKGSFSAINSSLPVEIESIRTRDQFFARNGALEPVALARSEFVSDSFVAHLMRNKRSSALGSKYHSGSKITNMEGALHTFLTPICPMTISGDYCFRHGHEVIPLEGGKGRKVVLSAAVQPDFELSGTPVVMKIVEIKEKAIEGRSLPTDFQPLWTQVNGNRRSFEDRLEEYEDLLQKHMVYHLTKGHRLPNLDGITAMQFNEALRMLESLIAGNSMDISSALENQFVVVYDHTISLEALFNVYLHQIRNEFSTFEALFPQGYVYTIDPPSIFSSAIGGVRNVPLLNRLQILAFKQLNVNSRFGNLKFIGFNNYADKGAVELYQKVFPNRAVPKVDLFKDQHHYSIKGNYALIIHNNSDAFGQNIETEGASSLDGAIGVFSDAACHLSRTRQDLLDNIM